MFRRKLVIRTYNRPLKKTPNTLYAVGVNVPAYPFLFRVTDGFVARVRVPYAYVVAVLIRVDRFTHGVGRFCYKLSELKTIAIRNHFQANFSPALNCPNHRSFVLRFESSPPAMNATADVGLINF